MNMTRGHQPRVGWERFLIYVLSFAGLMAVLFAVYGLLALVVGVVIQQTTTWGPFISNTDAKTQVSSYLAALIVGAPLWVGFWLIAQRRVTRSEEERQALERRLFFAATFAVTSIVALFAGQALLEAALTWPGALDRNSVAKNAVIAGAELLTYGMAWLWYARLGWRERSPRAADAPHDIAVCALTGAALFLLCLGLNDGLRHLIMTLQGTTGIVLDSTNETWTIWGRVASCVVAGGAIWVAITRYDLKRARRSIVRVLYLYLVLAIGVPMAAVGLGSTIFEGLRRAFGYQDFLNNWGFLIDTIPPFVVGVALWAFHWTLMRRQSKLHDIPVTGKGAIAWPRRPAIAALSLGGFAAVAISSTSLLRLLMDALVSTHEFVLSGSWWTDQLSAGIAGTLVGAIIWLPAWALLQRAARGGAAHESVTWERRWLLGTIVLVSALSAVGFTIALLYQIFRGVLQTTDANSLRDGLRYGSALVVAIISGGYYGTIFRRERKLRSTAVARVDVGALITLGAEETLHELRRRTGQRIAMVG